MRGNAFDRSEKNKGQIGRIVLLWLIKVISDRPKHSKVSVTEYLNLELLLLVTQLIYVHLLVLLLRYFRSTCSPHK